MLIKKTKWNHIKCSVKTKREKTKDNCNEQKTVTNVVDMNSTNTNGPDASIQRQRLSEWMKTKTKTKTRPNYIMSVRNIL